MVYAESYMTVKKIKVSKKESLTMFCKLLFPCY